MPTTIRIMSWNILNTNESRLTTEFTRTFEAQPTGKSYLLDYFVTVIKERNVDVVGFMEVLIIGLEFAQEITNKLGPEWKYSSSSRQQSDRAEQAVWIWKESKSLRLWEPTLDDDGTPLLLFSVVDDNSMAIAFQGMTDEYAYKVYDALEYNNYVKRGPQQKYDEDAFFLNNEKWSKLMSGGTLILTEYAENKTLDPPLTTAQLAAIKLALKEVGLALFPNDTERSPYMLNLNVGLAGQVKKLSLCIMHCPGPSRNKTNHKDPTHTMATLLPAIANLKLCEQLVNAEHLLLMGDFNVSPQLENKAKYQGYKISKKLLPKIKSSDINDEYLFTYETDEIEKSSSFFEVLTGAPLNLRDLMGNTVRTSLTSSINVEKMSRIPIPNIDAYNSNNYLSKPYDKFFFKSDKSAFNYQKVVDGTPTSTANSVDLIEAMDPLSRDGYQKNESNAAFKYFKSRMYMVDEKVLTEKLLTKRKELDGRLDEANAKKRVVEDAARTTSTNVSTRRVNSATYTVNSIQEQLNAIDDEIQSLNYIINHFNIPQMLSPIGTFASFVTYRLISDHLPIMVDLTTDT